MVHLWKFINLEIYGHIVYREIPVHFIGPILVVLTECLKFNIDTKTLTGLQNTN